MINALRLPSILFRQSGLHHPPISIKKLFLLGLCIALGLMLAIGFLVQLRLKQFEHESAELDALLGAGASLNNLHQTTHDYLLIPGYDARVELHNQAITLSKSLTSIEFDTIRARRLVGEILRRTNHVSFIFDELNAPSAGPRLSNQPSRDTSRLVSDLLAEYGQLRFIIRKAVAAQRIGIQKSRSTIFLSILFLSATSAGLMLALSRFIIKNVITRIEALYQGMKIISEGSFGHRIPIRRRDEIGRLGISFNAMTSRLQSSYAALQEEVLQRRQAEENLRILNTELEDRVRARTQDLATANQQLRMEIEERKLAETRVEAANRAKSDFLANMSHEIRTPMNGILGMTELILLTATEPKARTHLSMIKQSGHALLDIINDILDLSKIEAGKVELDNQAFSPREIVATTAELLDVIASGKSLRLTYMLDSTVPERTVGDEGRLRQILTNVMGNAVKFTQQGSVEVTVARAEDESRPSPGTVRLLFSVKDTGIGIPGDKLESVFESFSQVGESAHVKFGGTGLGLAISKQLVEMMGGKIWAESEPGAGSTFFFTVQLGLAHEQTEAFGSVQAALAPSAAPLRILLAEDDKISRIYVIAILEQRGHSVTAVGTGRKALEVLKHEHFDLVLMDVRMPEMNGEETTRRIRAGEAGDPKVTIVALTAYALKGDRERFLAVGMDDYLSKPIDIDELGHLLERVARRRDAAEPA